MGIFAIIDGLKEAEHALDLGTNASIGPKAGGADFKAAPPSAPEIAVSAVGTTHFNSSLRSSPGRKAAELPEGIHQGSPLSRSAAARQSIDSSSTGSADQVVGSFQFQPGGKAEMRDNFQAAWPWLQANLHALIYGGWSRRRLFQRGKNKYPAGQWGVAWIPVWRKNGLSLTINHRTGAIVFNFRGTDGRPVNQTAHPQQILKVSENLMQK